MDIYIIIFMHTYLIIYRDLTKIEKHLNPWMDFHWNARL